MYVYTLPLSFIIPTNSPSHFFFFLLLCDTLALTRTPYLGMGFKISTRVWVTHQYPLHERQRLPFPRQPLTAISTLWHDPQTPPHLWLQVWGSALCRSYAGNHGCCQVMSKTAFPGPAHALPCSVPWGGDMAVTFTAEKHSTFTCSQHCDQSWVSLNCATSSIPPHLRPLLLPWPCCHFLLSTFQIK